MKQSWPVRITTLGAATGANTLWTARGQLQLTVIVKATFALVHGAEMTGAEPEAIVTAELHHHDVPARSVRATSDLAPFLEHADVLLTGHAHAPAGQPAPMQAVRLAIYRDTQPILEKTLHVHGDRKGGPPEPFDKIPLVYERAFGGVGWKPNPLGVGYPPGASSRRPNIVDPANPERSAGFGPISRTWPSRKSALSKDARRAIDKQPIAEIPDGLGWAYFQAAPEDQRAPYLQGDERIVLEGMHPDLARLESRLPRARAIARIYGLKAAAPRGTYNKLTLQADMLRIDADARTCTLTWRGAVPIHDPSRLDALHVVAGVESAGAPIQWPAEAPAAGGAATSSATTPTEQGDASDYAETVAITRDAPKPGLSGETVALDPSNLAAVRPATPFSPPPEPAAPAEPFSETVALAPSDSLASRPATPFAPSGAAPPAGAPEQGAIPGAPWSNVPAQPTAAALGAETMALAPTPSGPAQPEVPRAAPPRAMPGPPITPRDVADPSALFHTLPRAQGAAPAAIAGDEPIPPRAEDTIPISGPTTLVAFTVSWPLKPGHCSRTVVVKGSFDLVPGGAAKLRGDTDPPQGDVHAGGEAMRSLHYPSDFAIFKPRADVTLKGHAHAPRGSAPAAQARFRFGREKTGFDRTIAVFGERKWQQAASVRLAPTEPQRFQKIPLVYERAFGGAGFDKNPVGAGYRALTLPNLEDPARLVKSPGDTPDPACFGAVPMLWEPRWSRLGTFGADWQKARWPYFPEDFDWAFFQAAPPAQQLERVEGDEPFLISGMHADHALIEGKLPGARPRCFAQKTTADGGGFHEVLLRLDTVTFDVDEMTISLVWRGLLEVKDDEASDVAELFVILEEMRERPIELAEAHRQYREARAEKAPPAPIAAPRDKTGSVGVAMAAVGAAAVGTAAAVGAAAAAGARTAAGAQPGAEPDPARRKVEALLAEGARLDDLDLGGADLSDLDFSSRSMVGANLKEALLRRSVLRGADLSGAQLAGADLTDAILDGARLDLADFTGASLDGASAVGATVAAATFAGVKGDRANFREARGAGASFVEASWRKARFDKADLAGADFSRATIDEAVFDGASLPEVRLYGASGAKASFKDATLTGARADGVRLVQCNLQNISAASSVFDKGVLDHSTFLGASLARSSFVKASCEGAVFSGADLKAGRLGRAVLKNASLLRVNLMEGSLEAADLRGADLRGANLHGAETWKAKLGGAQLDLAIVTQTKLTERGG